MRPERSAPLVYNEAEMIDPRKDQMTLGHGLLRSHRVWTRIAAALCLLWLGAMILTSLMDRFGGFRFFEGY